MHPRFRVNGRAIPLSDDFPEFRGGALAPPAGAAIHLEVDGADFWWARAVNAAAAIITPLADQFWDDRYGQLKYQYGHTWSIGMPVKTQHTADVCEPQRLHLKPDLAVLAIALHADDPGIG